MTPLTASAASAWVRQQRAIVRSALRRGDVPASQVLIDPPECVQALPLWRVLAWTRGCGDYSIEMLNREAMEAGINLAKPISRTSGRERAWAVEHLRTGSGRR